MFLVTRSDTETEILSPATLKTLKQTKNSKKLTLKKPEMKYNKPVKKQTKTVLRKVRPNLVSLIDGVDIANEYKVAYKEGSWEEIRENYNYIMKMTDDSHLWWNKHKDYSIKQPKKKKEKHTQTHKNTHKNYNRC